MLANGFSVAINFWNPLASGQQRIFRRSFRRFLGFRFVGNLHQQLELRPAVTVKARARRNDVTHDDVFLESAQAVHLGAGRGLGQHAGRVLEARGAQEAVGFERRLGDAQQHGRGFRRFAALFLDDWVFLLEVELFNLLAPEELGVAGLGNAHLAEHLAHDDFDVLVVDGHTLQAINFLHFADQVFLQFLRAADIEDFVRVHRAFGHLLAFLHKVALENDDMPPDGDEMFLLRLRLRVFDDDATLAADARPEIHDAVNPGNFRCVLGMARLEQFRHARETAGNVLGLGRLARRLGHERASDYLVAFTDYNMRAGRNWIVRHNFAVVVADGDLRMQILLVLDDDHGFLAGGFVHFLLHRHAFDDVVELHLAGLFRENRHVVGIPLHKGLALFDLAAVLERNDRADNDGVIFQFTTVFAVDGDGAVLVQHDVVAVFQFDDAEFVEFDGAIVFGLDLRNFEHLRRRAADVKCPHRQLRARLADGLRGDDADGFAELDGSAGGEVATVAMDANAALAFAGEHGANAQD